MSNALDIQEQIEKLDLQILSLIGDRVKLYNELNLEEDEADMLADTVALWIEEATERGLDEALAEKMAKIVTIMSRKVEA